LSVMKTSPFILIGFALTAAFSTSLAGVTTTCAEHFIPPSNRLRADGLAEAWGQGCQREACHRGVSVRVADGQVFSTSNGVNWVARSVPTPSRLHCVASG